MNTQFLTILFLLITFASCSPQEDKKEDPDTDYVLKEIDNPSFVPFVSDSDFNYNHPELKEGEVFVRNITFYECYMEHVHPSGFNTILDLRLPNTPQEKWFLNFQNKYKTARLGSVAYDSKGEKISDKLLSKKNESNESMYWQDYIFTRPVFIVQKQN